MKDWYKQLPDNHPAMIAAIDALGWEGKGIMDKLASLLQDIGDFELTEKILCRNFGFNTRKASRLVGILSDGFQKLREYFAKDSKVLKCFPKDSETSQSFGKLDAQNPRGSIKEEEKKEKETLRVSKKAVQENEKKIHFPKSPAGELVSHLHEKLVTKGLTPTFLNQNWSDIGVREANSLLATETAEEIRKAIDWFASDTRFWADHLNRMSHVRRNWDHYLRDKPTGTTTKKAVDASAASKLMEFPFVIHVLTNEIIPTADLELREGDAGVLWHGVNTYYPIGHLRGVEGYEPDKATGELSSNGRYSDSAALA